MAQAYHWTLEDINKLTYLQIMLLNHAAEVNRKRLDLHIAKNRDAGTLSPSEQVADMPLFKGRRVDELTSDEYMKYLGASGGKGPRVIKTSKAPSPPEG